MNLFSRIVNWHQRRANIRAWIKILKANPAGLFTFPAGQEGSALSRQHDPKAIARSIQIEPWAYVGAHVLGKNLSAAPLIAQQQTTTDGDIDWENMRGGPLYDLTQRPNPYEPMDVLLWRLVLSLMTSDAYLAFDKSANEIYHLNSQYVKVKANRDGIIGYLVTRGTHEHLFPPDEIIHLRMPNNLHEYYGQSPIEPVKTGILTNYHHRRFIKNYFRNSAVPSGILITEQQVDPLAAKETRKEWNAVHQGVGSEHRIGILGSGLKYQSITPPLKDLIVDTLYKMTREEILAVLGCPPVFAGVYEYANYANAEAQKRFLWENTILPMQRIIVGYMNIQLVPQYGERLRLKFDTSRIKALQPDENETYKRVTIAVQGGWMTINEARDKAGLEAFDEPVADELRIPQANPFSVQPESNEESEKLITVKSDTDNIKYNKWLEHFKTVKRNQRSLEGVFRVYFNQQLDRVLRNLDEITVNGKVSRAHLFTNMLNGKGVGDDNVKLIFDITAENTFLTEITDPVVRSLIIEAAMHGMSEVGVTAAFNVNNPLVSTMIETFQKQIETINESTYRQILKILTRGYEEGLSLSEIEGQLRKKYKEFSKTRAHTIAKTEMNGLVNGGHMAGYKEAGATHVRWSSAFLATSRPEHTAADGQEVLVGKPFDIGGDMLKYPGDPAGQPGNIINCYCAIEPVVE